MSGFAAVVHFDRAPVEPQLLDCLCRALRFRAPDGAHVQRLEGVGFAHAQMLIPGDPPPGSQPLCLDDRWWIVGDVRLYARPDLVRDLRATGTDARLDQPDAWLVLLSFRAWGTECLGRFNGDFSFAVWDSRTRELTCASDHFGTRPLFYYADDHRIYVSNTLSALRDACHQSTDLDDLFVADFLTLEFSLVPEATAYRRIRRLPPAHYLTSAPGRAMSVRRYWDLPAPPLELRTSAGDVRDRFFHLLEAAVVDRLPAGPVSLWLSGGMDSSSIAAIATKGARPGLMSFTAGSSTLAPDREPHLAAAIAEGLGLPHRVFDIDQHLPFEGWEHDMPFMPEPWHEPYWRRKVIDLTEVASKSRVVIGGEGADELLCPELTIDLLGRVPVPRLARDIARHVLRYRRLPPMGIRKTLRRWRGRREDYGPFARPPGWMNVDFVKEHKLAERLAEFYSVADDPTHHPSRPMGVNRLSWSTQMTRDGTDPGTIGLPLELRRPFLDLRLVNFLYSIPPLYWCSRKAILREAMAGYLPPWVLGRPKTSVQGSLLWAQYQRHADRLWKRLPPSPTLGRYVDIRTWETVGRTAESPTLLLRDLLPVSLNYWLTSLERLPKPQW